MTKKISGAEFPLAKIFSSDFDYAIPSYQRPYAWTEVQAGELFSDLVDFFTKEKDDTYFLGSIVLIKEEGKPHAEVIDGQQRLTTLTILLAALTTQFSGELRADFENYIREPGRASQGLKPKPRLELRERDRQFFADYIQGLKLTELVALDPAQVDNESQRNVRRNAEVMLQRLKATFGEDTDRLCEFGAFLVQRCFLVAVSTPSQQSAFRVFSVLNSRGLDLLPTDIIKSDVIGSIKQVHQEDFTEIWEELEVETGRDGFAEVFGHIRMIYAKEKARRSLLEEFRERVIPKVGSAEDLVSKVVEPYTRAYLIAKHCQYISTSNAAEINALLKWLNRIDNSDWLPSAMQFLAEHENDAAYVHFFLRKLERLAACMHICGYDVNARIERYATLLRALDRSHSMASPVEAVELTAFEQSALRRVLQSDIYLMTARRRNYLILRLDSFLVDGAATYDPTVLTIEHVLPQTVVEGSVWATQWPNFSDRILWLHRLANLVPLTQRRNSQAQNYDFERKKKAYFGGKQGVSSYALTTQVLNTAAWTPAVVEQRQADLLEMLSTKWELAET
ncbi:DUF262 domain-containing protein [Rivibacter subsaxonicus]|uniref:Uncharacterized protein DUF1524 n=1 Tax=Rivibacter subsaxonicus TaxID=457575 RepID=A0A4Q7W0X0_9BURK|nr:DUF262 domain-containing protein [Rivibacter subsaxonicus]RZU02159.1 uncharacterized protein DUF1524 [Rivibacter subsaxonicus]